MLSERPRVVSPQLCIGPGEKLGSRSRILGRAHRIQLFTDMLERRPPLTYAHCHGFPDTCSCFSRTAFFLLPRQPAE
jgi:hypothetical protein